MARGDTPAGWGKVKPGTPVNKKGMNMPSLDGFTTKPKLLTMKKKTNKMNPTQLASRKKKRISNAAGKVMNMNYSN